MRPVYLFAYTYYKREADGSFTYATRAEFLEEFHETREIRVRKNIILFALQLPNKLDSALLDVNERTCVQPTF